MNVIKNCTYGSLGKNLLGGVDEATAAGAALAGGRLDDGGVEQSGLGGDRSVGAVL